MALQKTISDPTGAQAQYWVVANVSIDKLSESAGITLTGYQDRQTRLDHPREGIVQRRTVAVPSEDFNPLYDSVVSGDAELYVELYNYVKANEDDLEDAEDVFEDPA